MGFTSFYPSYGLRATGYGLRAGEYDVNLTVGNSEATSSGIECEANHFEEPGAGIPHAGSWGGRVTGHPTPMVKRTSGEMSMKWREVCEHRDLQNLPFKIELNEQGKIIMSPVKVYHSAFQGKISSLLDRLTGGHVLTECAIETRKGTKVTDVAWASRERFKKIVNEVECSIAPEVCIEVLSSANTSDEIDEKKSLYFEKDCKEVWICSKQGKVTFYTHDGEIDKSNLIPGFPTQIDLFT